MRLAQSEKTGQCDGSKMHSVRGQSLASWEKGGKEVKGLRRSLTVAIEMLNRFTRSDLQVGFHT